MIDGNLIAALGGFVGGAVPTVLTAVRYAKQAADNGEEALRLLKGSEEIDGDGVIEIVQENREIAHANRRAIEASDHVPSPHQYE